MLKGVVVSTLSTSSKDGRCCILQDAMLNVSHNAQMAAVLSTAWSTLAPQLCVPLGSSVCQTTVEVSAVECLLLTWQLCADLRQMPQPGPVAAELCVSYIAAQTKTPTHFCCLKRTPVT